MDYVWNDCYWKVQLCAQLMAYIIFYSAYFMCLYQQLYYVIMFQAVRDLLISIVDGYYYAAKVQIAEVSDRTGGIVWLGYTVQC